MQYRLGHWCALYQPHRTVHVVNDVPDVIEFLKIKKSLLSLTRISSIIEKIKGYIRVASAVLINMCNIFNFVGQNQKSSSKRLKKIFYFFMLLKYFFYLNINLLSFWQQLPFIWISNDRQRSSADFTKPSRSLAQTECTRGDFDIPGARIFGFKKPIDIAIFY